MNSTSTPNIIDVPKKIKSHFPTIHQMDELAPHVLKDPNKNESKLEKMGKKWTTLAWENKLSYEIHWLGIPIIQTAEDMIIMQELLYKVRPDVLIETGVAHGGSLIYYASLFELLGNGRVIGVDIDIRPHNLKLINQHPLRKRVTLVEGNSTGEEMIELIKTMIAPGEKVMVVLDSDHTTEHVSAELSMYAPLVSKQSYLIVCDTIMPDLAGRKWAASDIKSNNGLIALKKFLKTNPEFSIDKSCNKLYVSHQPNGYLIKNA